MVISNGWFFFFLEIIPLVVIGLKGFKERAILAAMKESEDKTCIQFVKRTNEKDAVKFMKGGYGQ